MNTQVFSSTFHLFLLTAEVTIARRRQILLQLEDVAPPRVVADGCECLQLVDPAARSRVDTILLQDLTFAGRERK